MVAISCALLFALGFMVLCRGRWRWLGLASGLAVGLAVALLAGPSSPIDGGVEARRAGYATSDTCRACHPHEYQTWHRSYHRTMTQRASTATMQAPLPATLSDRGRTVRLRRAGETIMAASLGADGAVERERPLALLTGSHHFENYWMAEDDGWYVQFPFIWDLRRARWIPAEDSFLQPYDPRPSPPGVWNDNCAYCHSVNAAGRLSADGVRADSEVAELGIACEACHGPADAHVDANRDPLHRYAGHLSDQPAQGVVHPERLNSARATAVCGQCHGVSLVPDWSARHRDGDPFRPGDAIDASRALVMPVPAPDGRAGLMTPSRAGPVPALIDGIAVEVIGVRDDEVFVLGEPPTGGRTLAVGDLTLRGVARRHPGGGAFLVHAGPPDAQARLARRLGWPGRFPSRYDMGAFWDDGTVRTAGREYNGLAASACFTRGEMHCGSCHQMHGTTPADMLVAGGDGPGVCLECHGEIEPSAHSHHAVGSSGARCQNCHQPHTTFGLLGAIRSHRVDSPSAQMTAKHGRPNACNLCHLDRTLGWAADALTRWYGQPRPHLRPVDERVAAGLVWILSGDAAVRGVTAWALGWPAAQATAGTDWMAPHLIRLLDDDYAAVRSVAGDVIQTLPGFADLDYDFVAPQPQRRAAQAKASERLTTTRTAPTLLLQSGHVAAEADRLWQSRDRRPVFISE